ncbi:imidazole glycerol phosphate synthase subunit HisF [Treponema sp.]|uniref:imidazole glycerol phosphate synthase subunit HisF n=1 Tax=Treponema sp. TaxID=166 RepID=UPI001DD81D34|nr:imidazole glycerol phosphate synthase subunit HisF [Treponema sp.]MBS7241323.1 imidazole glycerol phosphate synthase subunit HisF [Treponema sp.]MCI6441527.1 imidazole glycerol phosphate synthase subunit HisF [Spirochaetia bacterium]MDY4133672.1 imidazole glycerol phosphate synthase subunit HisF [Treponema sp.]
MLKKRIIVCLDVKDGRTTKGVKFQNNVDIGDPVEMAAEYYRQGVDELVFYDIMASARGRGPILDLIARVASQVFIPFCVGGGIGTLDDIRSTILAGAEKVSLNSQAVKHPELIKEGARVFGNQCIVLGMDAAKDEAMPSGYRVYINGGRVATELDALDWAKKAVGLGAGEIVLNSIDADGTRNGYELNLTRMISENVEVPVIASGGGGTVQHLADVLKDGKADAALIASMVHSGDYTISGIKTDLAKLNVPVRM